MKKTLPNLIAVLLLLATVFPAFCADKSPVTVAKPTAKAGEGIKGRSSLAGKLFDKIEVRAYASRAGGFGPLTGDAVAARVFAAADGTYTLPLVPGRYVIEAIKKRGKNRAPGPETGDLYCLYSGSPVTVAPGQWTPVGLYLTEVPAETRAASDASRLRGTLTFKGKPVERAYFYAYENVDGAFRGPTDLVQPVAAGTFDVRLPPGRYYLVARKRSRGGPYGPIDTGDLFNFYPRNPVTLGAREAVTLEIPLIERLSQLDGAEGAYRGISIKVVDARGNPKKGLFVMAYGAASRTGHPAATAGPTGADGTVRLDLPPGAVHLRARAGVGGPLEEGETYGDLELVSQPGKGPVVLKLRP